MPANRPQRPRGKRTLERLVAAAAELLEEKALEDLSVAEVAQRAGVAVGSFYTWFPAKEDLLPHLYARYDIEVEQDAARVLAPERFEGKDLEGRVRILVDFLVRIYRTRRGLYRAALFHAATRPDEINEEARRRRRAMMTRAVSILVESDSEITQADPRAAAEFALSLVMSSLKDRVLLEEASRGVFRKLTDRRLARELTRAALAYLQAPERK